MASSGSRRVIGPDRVVAGSSSWGTMGDSPKMDDTGAPVCFRRTEASAKARCIASLTMATSCFVGVPRRPAAPAVGGLGVVVGFVDRLPPTDDVTEGLGHEVHMSSPYLCPVLLDEESSGGEEPPGKGEVVERNPRHDSGIVRRGEHVAIVADGLLVVAALVGLEAGPLDGQPVVGQAKGGQQIEVLGIPCARTRSLSGQRSMTGPFPIPPVRPGGRALTLCGRGASAPEEAFGPIHAREYAKKGTRRTMAFPEKGSFQRISFIRRRWRLPVRTWF